MAGGGLNEQPSATTLRVEELVDRAWRGHIRVPHFQRDFRWTRDDVIKLLDSVLKGYPIGSLLMWLRPAPARDLQLGALHIKAGAMDSALWVVDGQQRIVSLANAFHPDGFRDARFDIAYDMRSEKFVPGPAAETPTTIPLPVLFDLRQILGWFTKYPGAEAYLERAHELTTLLRQYPVPAYQVAQDDVRILEDIFDRLNNYGKRMRRSEIFSALHAGVEKDGADDRLTFASISDGIDTDLGFGAIDEDTVLKAVLARRGPDVMRDIHIEFRDRQDIPRSKDPDRIVIDFPGEDRDTAFYEGDVALRRAVAFLQNEAEVPHFSMVAYRYLLIVLTRVFAHHPEPGPRHLRLLRRWYWRAAAVGPQAFKGGTTGATRALAGAVRRHDLTSSVQDLLSLVSGIRPPAPDLTRFRSNHASTKIALCAWWAEGPRSLETGKPFTRADLAACILEMSTAGDAVHPIIPRMDVPYEYREWAANRVLMPDMEFSARDVLPLILQRPLGLDKDLHDVAIRSHLIKPEMVADLSENAVKEFMRRRQDFIDQNLLDFLSVMCEWEFEDTPPLEEFLITDPGDDANDD